MYALGRRGPDSAHQKAAFPLVESALPHWQAPLNISYAYLFGPVENQLDAPCCVAFATSSVHELKLRRHLGVDLNISERALYSLTKHHYEANDLTSEGLYTADALLTLAQVGYVLEQDWAYAPATERTILTPVPAHLVKTDHLIQDYHSVPSTVDAMILALATKGPLVVGTAWPQDWFTPQDGFLTATPAPEIAGGHDFVIVGYSKTKQHAWGQGAFLMRNQWGAWGITDPPALQGYAWIPFQTTILPDDIYTVQL